MVNVTHITKKLLSEKPYLHEALNNGLINIIALSEFLKPSIEKELGRKIKTSAIGMAIRRYSTRKIKKILLSKKADLTIKSNLIEITTAKKQRVLEKIYNLSKSINIEKGDILNIIQGNFEILILTNGYNENIIKKILKGTKTNTIKNLASISINIPKDMIKKPGFYYAITKKLLLENIPIVDIVNTRNEATIVLREDNMAKAFDILSKNIIIELFE